MELKGKIGGAMIPQEVTYADDVALVTTTRQENLKEFREVCVREEEEEEEGGGGGTEWK